MAAHKIHDGQQKGNHESRDPRAIHEFRHQHNQHRYSRNKCTQPVDKHIAKIAWPCALPMGHHARLRKSKGEKRTNGIQGYEPVGDTAKDGQQDSGDDSEDNNALRIHQAAAAIRERERKESIVCDHPANTRKIGKRSVRGKNQH